MSNENKKDFNKQMNDSKDMPRIIEMDDEGAAKWGGKSMVVAPPIDYDTLMRQVPEGKVTTTAAMRRAVAKKYGTAIGCPLTCGIFVNICAWASSQRETDITPYWRTLKAEGELNEKFPGGIEDQKRKLEAEGHAIIQKGRTKQRYFVENYEDCLFEVEFEKGK